MPTRVPVLKDDDHLKLIVKSNILECPSKSQKQWQHRSNEELCETYTDFLTELAKTGCRISSKALTKELKIQFEGPVDVLAQFSKALSQAASWSKDKVRQTTSGSKTEPGLLAIIKAWGRKPSSADDDDGASSARPLALTDVSSDVEILGDLETDATSEAKALQQQAMNAFAKDGKAPKRLVPCLSIAETPSPKKAHKAQHIATRSNAISIQTWGIPPHMHGLGHASCQRAPLAWNAPRYPYV